MLRMSINRPFITRTIDNIIFRNIRRERTRRLTAAIHTTINAAATAAVAATGVVEPLIRSARRNTEAPLIAPGTAVSAVEVVAAARWLVRSRQIVGVCAVLLNPLQTVVEDEGACEKDAEEQRIEHPAQDHVDQVARVETVVDILAPLGEENGAYQQQHHLETETGEKAPLVETSVLSEVDTT